MWLKVRIELQLGPEIYTPTDAMMVTINQAGTADMAHHQAHAGATWHSTPATRTNPLTLQIQDTVLQ